MVATTVKAAVAVMLLVKNIQIAAQIIRQIASLHQVRVTTTVVATTQLQGVVVTTLAKNLMTAVRTKRKRVAARLEHPRQHHVLVAVGSLIKPLALVMKIVSVTTIVALTKTNIVVPKQLQLVRAFVGINLLQELAGVTLSARRKEIAVMIIQ